MAFGVHVAVMHVGKIMRDLRNVRAMCFIFSMQGGYTLLGMSDLKPKRAEGYRRRDSIGTSLKTKAFVDLAFALKARTPRSG